MCTTLEIGAESTITDDVYRIIRRPRFSLHFLNLISLSLSLWSLELATLQQTKDNFNILLSLVIVHYYVQ